MHQTRAEPILKYSASLAEELFGVRDIHIEKEFIYWSTTNEESSIHKGFTEPFVEVAPISTFNLNGIKDNLNLVSNDYYVFFTGNYSVYGHLKHSTQSTVQLASKQRKVWLPKGLLAFRDTGLIVSNDGFISQIDVRMFPPSHDDI